MICQVLTKKVTKEILLTRRIPVDLQTSTLTERMPPRHFQVRLLAVWIYIYIAVMSFSCIHPCNGSFGTRPGLTRHQNGCPVFRTAQALKIEHRRLIKSKVPSSMTPLEGKAPSASMSLDARKARISQQGPKFVVSSLAACEVRAKMTDNVSCTSHQVALLVSVAIVAKFWGPLLYLQCPYLRVSNLQPCTCRPKISFPFLCHFLQ